MIWTFVDGKSRRIAREAANWRAEMEEPLSTAQVEAFEAWLKSNPAHLAAYRESDAVAEAGTRLPSMAHYLEQSARLVRRYRPAFAIAAMAALALGVWGLIRDPAPAYAAVTNRGQATRIVALNDGSVITLDTATMLEVAVAPTAHHVRMSGGRARFAVRSASGTPLRVTTSFGEVTSINGVFDVAVDNDVRVWVISGSADVVLPAAGGHDMPRNLGSGQGLRMQAGAAATPIGRTDTSWPDAHVAFDQTPLATVLRTANRKGQPTIAVADEALGKLRVTGVMDMRDTRKLARKLAAALGLDLVEKDGTLQLNR